MVGKFRRALRHGRTPRRWSQDRLSGDGPGLWRTCISSRYTYPSIGLSLGVDQRKECGADREGLQAAYTQTSLEQAALANYLLWS